MMLNNLITHTSQWNPTLPPISEKRNWNSSISRFVFIAYLILKVRAIQINLQRPHLAVLGEAWYHNSNIIA